MRDRGASGLCAARVDRVTRRDHAHSVIRSGAAWLALVCGCAPTPEAPINGQALPTRPAVGVKHPNALPATVVEQPVVSRLKDASESSESAGWILGVDPREWWCGTAGHPRVGLGSSAFAAPHLRVLHSPHPFDATTAPDTIGKCYRSVADLAVVIVAVHLVTSIGGHLAVLRVVLSNGNERFAECIGARLEALTVDKTTPPGLEIVLGEDDDPLGPYW